ncbi:MAG: LysE family translocator [Mangrovicoccus sp.]|nr:LysE family translocator [Mangrovicoccus sp.]
MSISGADLGLYALALFILFMTPGPVWLAILARTLSGGFAAAWPLAFGVAVGDILWPLLAIWGMSWIASEASAWLMAVRLAGAALFIWIGWQVIAHAGEPPAANSQLTRPGLWAGFAAGMAAILGNPKAILFYMGLLPGFFDLDSLNSADIALIIAASVAVPFFGNLLLAGFVDRVRAVLSTPRALRRLNISAGALLILVGLILPFV